MGLTIIGENYKNYNNLFRWRSAFAIHDGSFALHNKIIRSDWLIYLLFIDQIVTQDLES